jgi:hypothetical protein
LAANFEMLTDIHQLLDLSPATILSMALPKTSDLHIVTPATFTFVIPAGQLRAQLQTFRL